MMCPKTLHVVSSLVRIFPDRPEPEYDALKESISRLGLLDPILMWRGTVVDGFHRLRACLELGVEPRFDVLSADADPMEIVVDRMGTQRHLERNCQGRRGGAGLGQAQARPPEGVRKKLRKFARFPDPPVGLPEDSGSAKGPSPPCSRSRTRRAGPSRKSVAPLLRASFRPTTG